MYTHLNASHDCHMTLSIATYWSDAYVHVHAVDVHVHVHNKRLKLLICLHNETQYVLAIHVHMYSYYYLFTVYILTTHAPKGRLDACFMYKTYNVTPNLCACIQCTYMYKTHTH